MIDKLRAGGFKVVSLLGAGLFLWLFYSLLFTPGAICEGFGIEPSEAVFVIARRTSALMLGFVVLLWLARNLAPSEGRSAICAACAVTFVGFAGLGSYEILRGAMKSSVWGVVGVEVLFAVAFGGLWVADRGRARLNQDRCPCDGGDGGKVRS